MLAATATIGPRRPTAAAAVTISTSIRAAGTGTTTVGLAASPSVPSPKNKLKFTRLGLGWPFGMSQVPTASPPAGRSKPTRHDRL